MAKTVEQGHDPVAAARVARDDFEAPARAREDAAQAQAQAEQETQRAAAARWRSAVQAQLDALAAEARVLRPATPEDCTPLARQQHVGGMLEAALNVVL